MATGDGLLARLLPAGTITLDAMSGLCAAAQRHGNGVIEITSRGSVQVRGLRDAAIFADAVARLGIAAQDGVPVIADPLAGLDPSELIDAGAMAAELRDAVAAQAFAQHLAPKISVAIDGGGSLHLDALATDIRLRAVASADGAGLHVAIGGDAARALPLYTIVPADAVEAVVALLARIAAQGPQARARDVIRPAGARAAPPPMRAAADPVGLHPLRGGTLALGIAFAFGHTDAASLDGLMRAARAIGASGLRTAPGRALLILDVAAEHAEPLGAAAKNLGYVVDRDDPRRRVVACAGAPVCAAAEIPARALAPTVARRAAPLLAAGEVIHVSGCAKGCAHHGPAAITAIGRAGRCDLAVGDAPAGHCTVGDLPDRLVTLASARSARHG
jgi:precorrin-3B synthase